MAITLGQAIELIPENWFLLHLGEIVKPQTYAGDIHQSTGEYCCQLQHRNGGKLTNANGSNLAFAVLHAVEKVKINWKV